MSPVPDPDRWIERLKGEPAVREEAISQLRGIILRGLNRSLSNRYGSSFHAEDVVQDALLKILDSLDRFEGKSQFTTWAMAVAIRVGISELRKKHSQEISLDSISPAESLRIDIEDEEDNDVGQQIDRMTLIKQLRDLIATQLSEKQKLAVRAVLEGISVDEIARRTGSNRNAVYKLVHDARPFAREGFERRRDRG